MEGSGQGIPNFGSVAWNLLFGGDVIKITCQPGGLSSVSLPFRKTYGLGDLLMDLPLDGQDGL